MADIVGIMGGTFNPVHKGHIAIAKAAHEQFNISQILVCLHIHQHTKTTAR